MSERKFRVDRRIVRGVADRVRSAYIQERSLYEGRDYHPGPQWDGGKDLNGTVHKNIWMELAEKLLLHGIDPEIYVHYQFEHAGYWERSAARYPTAMLSNRNIEKFKEAPNTSEADLTVAFVFQSQLAATQIQLLQCRDGITMDRATQLVLINERISLSALFRYCLAASMKSSFFKDIKKRYRTAAAVQYAGNRDAYDATWGKHIPQSFRRLTEQLLGLGCAR